MYHTNYGLYIVWVLDRVRTLVSGETHFLGQISGC